MKINIERLMNDIEELSKISSTKNKDDGVTRRAYSEEDRKAKNYLKKEFDKIGIHQYEDSVGTLFAKLQGSEKELPVTMIGSHYDSVENGGAFDGTLGTLIALEVVRVIKENNYPIKRTIEFIGMNAEEGETFGSNTGVTNSRAMVGTLTDKELDSVKNRFGETKREAMKAYGLSANLEESIRDTSMIGNFIELHIEQGPILEKKDKSIGIVEYLPGIGRYKIIFTGKTSDSSSKLNNRKDALLAASIFNVKLNDYLSEFDGGITGSIGEISVYPNSQQFVASSVTCKIEMRTFSLELVKDNNITKCLNDILEEVVSETNVEGELIELKRIGYPNPTAPSVMDKDVVKLIEELCIENKFDYMILNNGTGHDSMIMCDYVDTNMIYVPSIAGISHSPKELTLAADIEVGAQLLLELVLKLDDKYNQKF